MDDYQSSDLFKQYTCPQGHLTRVHYFDWSRYKFCPLCGKPLQPLKTPPKKAA